MKITNCNGVEYDVHCDNHNFVVRRLFNGSSRSSNTWHVNGAGDIERVLSHYGIRVHGDMLATFFWTGKTHYKGWNITYDPKPIPVRDFDYDITHPDHEGEPSHNTQAGSLWDAMEWIDNHDA
jgi:hypothetical protein